MMRSNKPMSVDAPREREIPHTWKPTKRNAFVGINFVCVRLNALVSWLLASSPFFPVLTALLLDWCVSVFFFIWAHILTHPFCTSGSIHSKLKFHCVAHLSYDLHTMATNIFWFKSEYIVYQRLIVSNERKETENETVSAEQVRSYVQKILLLIQRNITYILGSSSFHSIKTIQQQQSSFFHCNNKQKSELPHRKMMLFELLRSSIWFVRLHNFRIIPNSLDSSFFFSCAEIEPFAVT